MATLNFDASQVKPDAGRAEPVPAGWYDMKIVKSEVVPTKTGGGLRLNLEFEVIQPVQFAGRKVFEGLNIRNSNATAQEIALGQLSAIAHAVGVLNVADSQQLHGIPLKCRVKVKAADGQYEARNEMSAYRNINEQVEMSAGVAYQAAPSAPAVQAPAGFGQVQQQTQQPIQTQQAAPQQPWGQPAQAPQVQQQVQQQAAAQQVQQPWNQPAQAVEQVQQQPNVGFTQTMPNHTPGVAPWAQ